ncbi:MAG: hypothetical protein SFX18_00925 [Pirellulales bacterium]|nr:hypothetical protein [Pirellulales bacterium]
MPQLSWGNSIKSFSSIMLCFVEGWQWGKVIPGEQKLLRHGGTKRAGYRKTMFLVDLYMENASIIVGGSSRAKSVSGWKLMWHEGLPNIMPGDLCHKNELQERMSQGGWMD